jgi:peptidyl-prolyl cis-trans isomerase C
MRCALVCLLLVGCGSKSPAATRAGDTGSVVARVDGQPITVTDVQRRIDALDPYSKARFSSPEQRKKFLENMVRFEVLAREAQNRGYDRDPDVQRVVKNQMIETLLRKELDEKLKAQEISDAQVAEYYRKEPAQFRQPEQVRVSQILVKDKATAAKVAAEARTAGTTDSGFRALVTRYSEDEDSKAQGGDLTFFDRTTTEFPPALVEAAFALEDIGDLSGPVASDKGFHILRLTQRRPGFTRPLAGVAAEIRRLIWRDRRAKKMEEMVAQMREKLKVEIYEDELAKVTAAVPGVRQ